MQGWKNIIQEMKEKLNIYPGFHIIDIKEKYGILRVIYHYEGDEESKNEIRKIINEAIDKSSKICESCGEDGDIVSVNSWMKTLCKKCYKKIINDKY